MSTFVSFQDEVFACLLATSFALRARSNARLKAHALSTTEYVALRQLANTDELSVMGVGARLRVSASTVSRTLTALVRKGLIHSDQGGWIDHRYWPVRILPEGTAAYLAATRALGAAVCFAELREDETKLFYALLQRLTALPPP